MWHRLQQYFAKEVYSLCGHIVALGHRFCRRNPIWDRILRSITERWIGLQTATNRLSSLITVCCINIISSNVLRWTFTLTLQERTQPFTFFVYYLQLKQSQSIFVGFPQLRTMIWNICARIKSYNFHLYLLWLCSRFRFCKLDRFSIGKFLNKLIIYFTVTSCSLLNLFKTELGLPLFYRRIFGMFLAEIS